MIEWISANMAVYGPLLVGATAMFETALIIGIVLPAWPTILVATAFALEGPLQLRGGGGCRAGGRRTR